MLPTLQGMTGLCARWCISQKNLPQSKYNKAFCPQIFKLVQAKTVLEWASMLLTLCLNCWLESDIGRKFKLFPLGIGSSIFPQLHFSQFTQFVLIAFMRKLRRDITKNRYFYLNKYCDYCDDY